jgi:elongation factor G
VRFVLLLKIRKTEKTKYFGFNNNIKGGAIPGQNIIGACEKGFHDVMEKGPLAAFPVINIEVDLNDGKHHDVDSSDMAFRIASRQAMRQAYLKAADPVILEPYMQVQVETPDEYQGFVIGDLSSRRGIIQGSETNENGDAIINALVPLS